MDKTEWKILKEIAELEKTPRGRITSASTASWTTATPPPTSTSSPRQTNRASTLSSRQVPRGKASTSPWCCLKAASPTWSTTTST